MYRYSRLLSRFFVSTNHNSLGTEIEHCEVFDVNPNIVINNVDKPLFAFWRVPLANRVQKCSPLGVSVFQGAIKQIMEADLQWDRYLWEFEGGEMAIDADATVLKSYQNYKYTSDGQSKLITKIKKSKDRLFRRLNARSDDGTPLYQVFAPALRDEAYARGLEKILRKIEFNSFLAYGTLSDPQNVDKTATEILSAKQRSYNTVKNMQSSLQTTLEHYIYAIDVLTNVCNLSSAGTYETKFDWGDGILENKDKEQAIQLQEVNSGIRKKTDYLMWRYGVTEKQAIKMLPEQPKFKSFFNEGGGS